MFGARCSTELTPDITHVVAAKVSVTIIILVVFPKESYPARNGESRYSPKTRWYQDRLVSLVHGLHSTVAAARRDPISTG